MSSNSNETDTHLIPMPKVALNSLITMCAGLATGALYSAYKGKLMGPSAIQMGSMWGSTGVLYWYTRANIFNYLTANESHQQSHVITTRRKLTSSIGAGLATGVLSTSVVYGPKLKIIAPSGLVAMALAGSLQWLYSYAQKARIDFLVWYYNKRGYTLPGNDEHENRSQLPTHSFWTLIPFVPEIQKQVRDTLTTTKWLPIRILTDEEYADRLNRQLQALNADLATYEKVMHRLQDQINELENH